MFVDCCSLKNIHLPERLKKIANSAFSGCKALEALRIPDGVREIERRAFYECTGMTLLEITHRVSAHRRAWGLPKSCKISVSDGFFARLFHKK